MGIVGLGNIGQAVMARLKPFGVSKFVYCGRTKKDPKLEDGAEFVGFEDLLKESDFVIVTCSYTPDLSKKFNKEAFKLMKKTSIFINTSRGGIVDQEALVEALSSKSIFAAGNVSLNIIMDIIWISDVRFGCYDPRASSCGPSAD